MSGSSLEEKFNAQTHFAAMGGPGYQGKIVRRPTSECKQFSALGADATRADAQRVTKRWIGIGRRCKVRFGPEDLCPCQDPYRQWTKWNGTAPL